MRTLALFLAVPAVALASFGCQTSPINVDAMRPASVADVDAVREDLATSIGAVKADLDAAKVPSVATTDVAGQLDANVAAAKANPSPGAAGALIEAIVGSGVVPPGLDWILSLLAGFLGLKAGGAAMAKRKKVVAPPTPKPAV